MLNKFQFVKFGTIFFYLFIFIGLELFSVIGDASLCFKHNVLFGSAAQKYVLWC